MSEEQRLRELGLEAVALCREQQEGLKKRDEALKRADASADQAAAVLTFTGRAVDRLKEEYRLVAGTLLVAADELQRLGRQDLALEFNAIVDASLDRLNAEVSPDTSKLT